MKYLDEKPVFASVGSLPVRGAWVEMDCGYIGELGKTVAPRAGSVG